MGVCLSQPICYLHAASSHVADTNEIKPFALVEETAVAKGVRRIVALTGEDARRTSEVANEFAARLKALTSQPANALEEPLKVVGSKPFAKFTLIAGDQPLCHLFGRHGERSSDPRRRITRQE